MSAELLPCPFCGDDTPQFERRGTSRRSCIVICVNCGCRHESSDEGESSGSSWNDRADLASAPAQPVAPKANPFHDEGAIAQCGYCRRYTLDRAALSDRQPVCTCGKQHGWSGSFKKPGADAQWHGAAPKDESAVPKCLMCGGHGLVGGHSSDGSHDDRPCPDCNSPDTASALLQEALTAFDKQSAWHPEQWIERVRAALKGGVA